MANLFDNMPDHQRDHPVVAETILQSAAESNPGRIRGDFFDLTLQYRGEALAGAVLDGKKLDV